MRSKSPLDAAGVARAGAPALEPALRSTPPRRAAPAAAARGPALGAPARVRRAVGLTRAVSPAVARAVSAALVGTLAAVTALAAPPAPGGKPFGCLIEPDRVADIGSQVVGLVDQLAVERGDVVRSGQPLVRLRADVERANVAAAESRAQIDADVQAAQANLLLAQQKLRRAQELLAQNFVSEQAVEQARVELTLAKEKLAQSRGQKRIWSDERKVAQAQLALRTVRSPFDGVVVERFVNLGERVEEKPLLRIATIDPLRIELMVPSAAYGTIRAGDQLTIRPELPGAAPVIATVRRVDSVLDAASNSFRVRASLPNPDRRLPAGLRCKADLPGVAAASADNPAATKPPRRL